MCGVPLAEAGAALGEFRPLRMRSAILDKRGVRVINDCYNANPGSVRAALDLTADIAVPGRRVAVLGDMLELGEASPSLHEGVGRHAAGRVDVLLGTGPLSAHTVRGAREAGLKAGRALHFEDRAELVQHLEQEVSKGGPGAREGLSRYGPRVDRRGLVEPPPGLTPPSPAVAVAQGCPAVPPVRQSIHLPGGGAVHASNCPDRRLGQCPTPHSAQPAMFS